MVAYVKAAKAGTIKEPRNKSYENTMFVAKLKFFLIIAKEIQPLLKYYQADRPLLPFFAQDIFTLIKGFMERFIKTDVMKTVTSMVTLLKIDTSDTNNHTEVSSIKVGFVTDRILRGIPASNRERLVFEFKMNCKQFLIKMIQKLIDKSPICSPLVRNMIVLDPRVFLSLGKQSVGKKLTIVLRHMTQAGRLLEDKCDNVLKQLGNFHDAATVSNESITFSTFNPHSDNDRIDTFYYNKLANKPEYEDLWGVVKNLLLLSHGQASVERGFSVNKEVMVQNLAEQSLVAQCIICDHVKSVDGIANVTCSKELLISATSARQRYQAHLDDMKKERESVKVNERKRTLTREVTEVEGQKKRLKEDIDALIQSADNYAERAESSGYLTLIAKSNGLRKAAKEKRVQLNGIESQLDQKMKELKTM